MAWDFETDAEFQEKLDWMDRFVTDEVEPLDHVLDDPYDKSDERAQAIIRPLQATVRDQGLWACHLGPDLGGPGYGQLKLALMNQILGRSRFAPSVFGCQAPDSGNAEILAHFGSDSQKERYLTPLLNGEISSCYSMTEPHAGADPTLFKTTAVKDGDEWVMNGQKVWSSGAQFSEWGLLIARSDPDAVKHKGMTAFMVPLDHPGVEVRPIAQMSGGASFNEVFFNDARFPDSLRLGPVGEGWKVALTTLSFERDHSDDSGGGRVGGSWDLVLATARAMGRTADPVMRQKLADLYINHRIEGFVNRRAADLARVIFDRIESGDYAGREGFYHFSNEGVCSWFDFAHEIAALAGHTSCKIRPCHSAEFPSKVQRPNYSVLDKTKIKTTFGIDIPHWRDSLVRCMATLR